MGFLAYILPVDGSGGRPDNTLPQPPLYPGNALPGQQPGIDNSLPGMGGRPDNSLPGSQPGVDNTLPGVPGRPDNTLPGAQPKVGTAVAGAPPASVDASNGMWVLVAVQGKYVWAWAQQTASAGSGDRPDNTLPGGPPPTAGQLPGQTPQPKK